MATPLRLVIIVDDDSAVRNSLKFALEVEGFEVRTYGGGPQALADASSFSRGCMVVDYYMPSMTGIELIEELRRRSVNLPAILITAQADPGMRDLARRSGFHAVLEKPLSDGALLDSIRAALAIGRERSLPSG